MPDPRDPDMLSYATPEHDEQAMLRQAFAGTIVTVIVVCAAAFVAGFFSSMFDSPWWCVAAFGGIASVVVIAAIRRAEKCRRSIYQRGWAIGIYLGLGLGALFWGFCGMVIVSLRSIH